MIYSKELANQLNAMKVGDVIEIEGEKIRCVLAKKCREDCIADGRGLCVSLNCHSTMRPDRKTVAWIAEKEK